MMLDFENAPSKQGLRKISNSFRTSGMCHAERSEASPKQGVGSFGRDERFLRMTLPGTLSKP
jgi:hypothetical protein